MKLPVIPALLVAAMVAGCGSADGPVPDVVGDRLDVAQSVMSDAGYDTEALGGGMFGIIDESNWTVCETRPASGATGAGTVKLIVERTCGENATATAAVDEEPVDEEPVDEAPIDDAAFDADVEEAAPSRPKRIRVPDVVGMDHQKAQDTMQAAGLYMLDEEDASGRGRLLLYDRNWTVVRQSPKAGARVREERTIRLFSVKDDEL